MPHVKVLVDGKYPFKTTLVPPSVSNERDILNKVVSLKFVDHNITDKKTFPEMSREKYLCTKSIEGT
jgi:hypothetical protein